jgi:hypothetical protein
VCAKLLHQLKKAAFFVVALLMATSAYSQRKKAAYTAATDSTYGYTAHNPLRLKQGDIEKSIGLSQVFLRDLRTADDQPLQFLRRTTVHDPQYVRPAIQLTDRSSGMPINGAGGLLDMYLFKTATNDTVRLFVDVYHKGPRLVPKGLKYVGL